MLAKSNFLRVPSVLSLIIRKSPAAGVAVVKEFMSNFNFPPDMPKAELFANETDKVSDAEPLNVEPPEDNSTPLPTVNGLERVPENPAGADDFIQMSRSLTSRNRVLERCGVALGGSWGNLGAS